MPNEIVVSVSLRCVNGNYSVERKVSNLNADQSVARGASNVQAIGTTPEELSVPLDIETAGYAFFRNLSTTETIKLGLMLDEYGGTGGLARIKPGGVALIPLDTESVYAVTEDGVADLEWLVLHD